MCWSIPAKSPAHVFGLVDVDLGLVCVKSHCHLLPLAVLGLECCFAGLRERSMLDLCEEGEEMASTDPNLRTAAADARLEDESAVSGLPCIHDVKDLLSWSQRALCKDLLR